MVSSELQRSSKRGPTTGGGGGGGGSKLDSRSQSARYYPVTFGIRCHVESNYITCYKSIKKQPSSVIISMYISMFFWYAARID